jgi:hypothetical protein
MMPKRITVMLEDNLIKNLRHIQAEKIQSTSETCSFSQLINKIISKKLK